jgi:hypothetical protein
MRPELMRPELKRPELIRPGAAALVFALLVTGCSGSSSAPTAGGPSATPTPSPSIDVPGQISSTGAVPAGYLTGVDATCAASIELLRKRGPAPAGPADPSRLTAAELRAAAPYLQRGADIQRAADAALGRFPAPPTGADAWAAYRTAVTQFAAGTQAEATAAKSGRPRAFLAAARRLLALRTKALESGQVVGLGAGTACARLF